MGIKQIFLGASVSALGCLALSSVAMANDDYESGAVKQHYSIGVNVGTSMIGIDAGYKINNYLEPRVFGNYFQWTINDFEMIDDQIQDSASGVMPDSLTLKSFHIPTEFKAVYANLGATMDFHPFKNGFFLSAGIAYNNTRASFSLDGAGLKVVATPHIPGYSGISLASVSQALAHAGYKIPAGFKLTNGNVETDGSLIPVTIGDEDMTLKEALVNTKVEVKWNTVVPYFGLGFRGNFAEANLEDPTFLENLGFTIEAGAFYYGKPTLTFSGKIGKELEKEIKDGNDIDSYTKYLAFWPVFRLGLSYRF